LKGLIVKHMYLCMGHVHARIGGGGSLDNPDGRAVGGERVPVRRRWHGSTVPPWDVHLGDRVHLITALLGEGRAQLGDVHDVVLSLCRELRTGLLTLCDQGRLVHVEHVQRHLNQAEGEPQNVGKLQKY
jgi:hypothetical protein